MKKLFTILLLAMVFIGLTPLALAEAGSGGNERTYQVNKVDANDAPKPVLISANITVTEANEMRQERVETAEKKIEQARERYENAKENLVNARERYEESRTKFEEKRNEYSKCKADDSEECVTVRKETKERTKNVLSNTADRVIAALEKLKERVEMAEGLSEEEAADMIARIEARIAELQDAGDDAENLDGERTNDEIKESAGKIKNAWQKTQHEMKRQAGVLVNEKIGGAIVKSEKLQERLENAIAKLEEKGVDVSAAEELVGEFESNIAESKENYESAMEKFREARGEDGSSAEAMKSATAYMKEAHKKLQEAHSILRQLLKEIKQTQNGEDALDEAEEEEEDESGDNETESEDEDEVEIEDESDDNETEIEVEDESEDNETESEDESDDESCTVDADCETGKFCDEDECKDLAEVEDESDDNETESDDDDDNNSTGSNV